MAEETMNTATATDPQGSAPAGAEPNAPTNYDELLKTDKTLQSWLDKRVNTATQTAVQSALEKERLLADEKVSEAEKLAKMNKEERSAYELQKVRRELEQYKAREAANGLRTEALKVASEQGVPAELVELIPFGNVTAEEVSRKIGEMKAVFDAAVADKVAKSLSGSGVPKGGQAGKAAVTPEDFSRMDYTQRLSLKQQDPALYQSLNEKGR